MPKQSAKAEFSTFVKGLITEASPLNFPANASLDEENFELNRTGTRFRRRGMDYEAGHVDRLSPAGQEVLLVNPPSSFKWLNVGGDGASNYLVVQTGRVLNFFNMDIEPLSGQTPYQVTLSDFPDTVPYSFTVVDGKLIVAAGVEQIASFYKYGNSFFFDYLRLLTRDVWGLEEYYGSSVDNQYETDPSYRGTDFRIPHQYNLQNQSWGIPRKSKDNVLADPTILYQNALGVWPSNSEQVWTGLQFQPVASGQDPFERVFTNLYQESLGSDLKTAKGYFIIDLLKRGASREAQFAANHTKYPQLFPASVSGLNADYSTGGPSIITEFAGRVFYAGFNGELIGGDKRSPNLSNLIFFSQLVKKNTDIIKCYQESDPTSRDGADLLDTDGGFIRVSGMQKPLAMINMATHLIVIAVNGVWAIQGGSDFGFTATNYKVDKISAFGGLAAKSIVEFSGKALFWGEDGIYLIQKDQFGTMIVNSVTDTTIQTLYDSIDNVTKSSAVVCYDAIGKKVRWLYKTGTPFTSTSEQRELVFDIILGAFSKNKIYNSQGNNVEVVSMFSGVQFKSNDGVDEVFVDADLVLDVLDEVVIPDTSIENAIQTVRYLTVSIVGGVPYYTFSYYRNQEFIDWPSTIGGGVDAKAYLLCGHITGGDSSNAKQVPYLTMHFYRTEDGVDINYIPIHQSSCKVRGQWDFANSINSNKWGPLWEAYRYRKAYLATSLIDTYDTGFELISSKTKLRGRGKAFSLYLETSPLKDCKIVGWSLSLNGNQVT